MSFDQFDDSCRGCRPVIADPKGNVLPDSSPEMQKVLAVWSATTLEERKAFHDVTCKNSRDPQVLDVVHKLMMKMAQALEDQAAKKLKKPTS